jgi:hypothetical protein
MELTSQLLDLIEPFSQPLRLPLSHALSNKKLVAELRAGLLDQNRATESISLARLSGTWSTKGTM